ncbi:MAG: LysR family transcriptional regulator [Roseibium sp.]|uniref:LysR family transcriptional regulator n=1 Tax=Roseibium sp. TaxID=1936156 RepID=UPI0026172123|nr:LysR family transcriptional regulator [Roseibium sp.]MCV0426296.1 LysR family transcriptional regulator [Roseibium sp.]
MEIDWLEDFLALSTAGVFARAADARNISQSAFTRRIKNLENWAGTPLFDRSVHPVELTAAGKAFRKTAIETVNALNLTKDDIRSQSRREADTLDFVALHTLAISFFPSWLNQMVGHLGPVKTRLVAENFSGCAEAILNGSADFMLCYSHPSVPTISDESRYPSATIAKDKIIAVSAVNSAGDASYNLDGADELPYLSYPPDTFLGRISRVCLDRGSLRDVFTTTYENSVAEALKSACFEGHGVTFLPERAVKRELAEGKLVRVSKPEFEVEVYVKLYRSIERSRPQLERFWRLSQKQP